MSTARPTVLFDLDGTLVDSNYLHTLAWARTFADFGEWAPTHTIHRLIGMGADQLLPTLLGRQDDAMAARSHERFREVIGEVRWIPGAAELVRELRAVGSAVVLATSSPPEDVHDLLAVAGLTEGDFDAITTKEDATRSKPDPAIFLAAMARAGGEPAGTIVVGDSVWDVRAASAAHLPCVGVETGGTSEAELRDAGAIAVYADVETLRRELAGSPLGELVHR